EVAESGPTAATPTRAGGGGRTAVDADDHRIFFCGIVILGIRQPTLYVEAFVCPLDRLGPDRWLSAIVQVGNLVKIRRRSRPKLGRNIMPALGEGDDAFLVGVDAIGEGDGIFERAATYGHFAEIHRRTGNDGLRIYVHRVQQRMTATVFYEADGVVADPVFIAGRAVDAWSDVNRHAAFGVDDPDIAASGALVAHQAADKGDVLAVGGPAGNGDLQAVHVAGNSLGGKHGAGLRADGVVVDVNRSSPELRDPPVVFSRRVGSDVADFFRTWGPAKLVDMQREGRKPASDSAGNIHTIKALHFDAVFADDAGPRLHRIECAGRARGIFDEQESDRLAIRRPCGLLEESGDVGQLLRFAAGFRPQINLRLARLFFLAGAGRGVSQPLSIGRPHGCSVRAARRADDFVFGRVGIG